MYHQSNINILRRVDLEHEHVESMGFELKTKVHLILINIKYRSEFQMKTLFADENVLCKRIHSNL
jgi:hypothetical protein